MAKNLATMTFVKRVKIGEFRDRASEVVILNRDREVAKASLLPPHACTG